MLASLVVIAAGQCPVLETPAGKVAGFLSGIVCNYLSVPYAAPPVGSLRWQRPAAPVPWSGVRPAVMTKPPSCMQNVTLYFPVSEDCLYANFYIPFNGASITTALFFIHGGSFLFGGSNLALFDGGTLAISTGAAVVTINYRLGALGYLSAAGAVPNAGLLDQAAALKFARASLPAARFMMFGESAGAISACFLSFAPWAPQVEAVLLQSGPCVQGVRPSHQWSAATAAARSAAVIPLMNASADAIIQAQGKDWGPWVDGSVVLEDPNAALVAGRVATTATVYIGGNVRDEGTLFVPPGITAQGYDTAVRRSFGAFADQILARYPPTPTPAAAYAYAYGLWYFVCPTRRLTTKLSGGASGWAGLSRFYVFDHRPSWVKCPDPVWCPYAALGVYHSSDLFFTFGYQPPGVRFTQEEMGLAQAMMEAWGNAVAASPAVWARQQAPPAFTNYSGVLPPPSNTGWVDAECDFWDSITS